ncbi:MAG: glycerol kinase GlpK [Planctomycetota bacterium]
MDPTVLALDAGTTAITGVLFDADLRPLARAAREFPTAFPRPGWVEQDAARLLAAVDEVLAALFAAPAAAGVAAVGVTNQRETVFALDRARGKALRPGIVWQDRRTAARCRALAAEGRGELLAARTGLRADPYFSATKIEWMLAEDPALRARARRGEVVFATVDSLVLHHLAGGGEWITDPTNASRTLLFDIDRRAWDGELCALFGVEPGWLPAVRGSVGELARTSPRRAGGRALPVTGLAGDQQAALFGQGCFAPGALKATFGTGSFLVLFTGAERVSSRRGLLTTLAVARDGSAAYAMEGSVFVSGALVQFLRDRLGWIARAEEVEALARTVPDSAGVFVVPAFTGLGAPYWDPDARGAILGLTRGTTPAHIARASLEAIAFQNAELIEILREESGWEVPSLLADGGAARNDLLLSLQADLAGLEVRRPPDVEATARGAAALAALGAGLLADPARAGAFAEPLDSFRPSLGAADRGARLAAWREAVGRVLTR